MTDFMPCLIDTELVLAPSENGRVYLADLCAELHVSEAELGYFAYTHLSDADYNPHAGTLSEDGAEALRTFIQPEG